MGGINLVRQTPEIQLVPPARRPYTVDDTQLFVPQLFGKNGEGRGVSFNFLKEIRCPSVPQRLLLRCKSFTLIGWLCCILRLINYVANISSLLMDDNNEVWPSCPCLSGFVPGTNIQDSGAAFKMV